MAVGGASTYRPLITPTLFSHRPPADREKRENSQGNVAFNPARQRFAGSLRFGGFGGFVFPR